jgi:hypothetical protein
VEESINKRSNWKANGLDSILAAVVERKSNAIASNGHSNGNEDENSKSTSSLYPDLVQAANQRRKQIQVGYFNKYFLITFRSEIKVERIIMPKR